MRQPRMRTGELRCIGRCLVVIRTQHKCSWSMVLMGRPCKLIVILVIVKGKNDLLRYEVYLEGFVYSILPYPTSREITIEQLTRAHRRTANCGSRLSLWIQKKKKKKKTELARIWPRWFPTFSTSHGIRDGKQVPAFRIPSSQLATFQLLHVIHAILLRCLIQRPVASGIARS